MEMAEYIERENYCKGICLCDSERCGRDSCTIWKAHVADVAPVVRCKECANFRQNPHGVCYCDEYGGAITPEDYCSRAVRKSELPAR